MSSESGPGTAETARSKDDPPLRLRQTIFPRRVLTKVRVRIIFLLTLAGTVLVLL